MKSFILRIAALMTGVIAQLEADNTQQNSQNFQKFDDFKASASETSSPTLGRPEVLTKCYEVFNRLIALNRGVDGFLLPPITSNESIPINYTFNAWGMEELNPAKNTLSFKCMHEFHFKMELMTWSLDECPMHHFQIPIFSNLIWHPTGSFSNYHIDYPYEWFYVKNDGTTVYSQSGTMVIHCILKMTWFPLDSQLCTATMAYLETGHNIGNITFNELKYRATVINPLYDLVMLGGTIQMDDLFPLQSGHISFLVRRNPMYYIPVVMLPTAILGLLPCLVFIVPTDSGETMTIILTTLLSYFFLLTSISITTPSSSISTPGLLYVYDIQMAVAAVYALFAACIQQWHHKYGLMKKKILNIEVDVDLLNKFCLYSYIFIMICGVTTVLTVTMLGAAEQLRQHEKDMLNNDLYVFIEY